MSILLSLSPFTVFFVLMRLRLADGRAHRRPRGLPRCSACACAAGASPSRSSRWGASCSSGALHRLHVVGRAPVDGGHGAASRWTRASSPSYWSRWASAGRSRSSTRASGCRSSSGTRRSSWRSTAPVSWAWAGSFAVHAAADAAAEFVPAIPLAVDIGASVVALAAAVWFTRWYPRRCSARCRPPSPPDGVRSYIPTFSWEAASGHTRKNVGM